MPELKRLLWLGEDRFRYEDCPAPPAPGPGEVRLGVRAVGICGTDLHILDGDFPAARPPRVLGHEIAGEVLEVGSGVERLRPGDRVTVDQVIGCGACFFCRRGSAQFCTTGCELGITRDGGCQEQLVVPERNLHAVPESIGFEEAAILDMEVWAALAKATPPRGTETCLVIGHGPAGLIACQILRAWGAGHVILAGRSAARLAKAASLQVADRIVSTPEELRDALDPGADLVFECAGTPSGVQSAIEHAIPGGRIVLFGVQPRPLESFDLNRILLKDLVLYGSLSDRHGWPEVIEMVHCGQLRLGPLITHRFRLDQAQQAYDLVRRKAEGVIKAVFVL